MTCMKQFLLTLCRVLRNAGAYFCVSVAVIGFFVGIISLFWGMYVSIEKCYHVAISAFLGNFAIGGVVFLGVLLRKADPDAKADFTAYCGFAGALSMMFFAVIAMIAGFCACHFFIPLLILIAGICAFCFIFGLTEHYAVKFRHSQPDSPQKA